MQYDQQIVPDSTGDSAHDYDYFGEYLTPEGMIRTPYSPVKKETPAAGIGTNTDQQHSYNA